MQKITFSGRCPTAGQVRAKVRDAIRAGHDSIEVVWGENWIELERRQANGFFGPWFGHGWIRRVSGDELARELSQSVRGES